LRKENIVTRTPLLSTALLAFLGFLLQAGLAPAAQAELPPSAYESMRAAAAEVLELEIASAERTESTSETGNEKDSGRRTLEITAIAKVRKVKRSAKGVKSGAVIQLRYTTFEYTASGWAGPSPVLQIVKGHRYRSWLQQTWDEEFGVLYVPVAGGWSFETLDDKTAKRRWWWRK